MSILFEPKDVNRFWLHVDLDGPIHPIHGQCWVWTAGTRDGYGQIKCLGRRVNAHRLSWEINCGEIPDGFCVLHKCDNRLCVNPFHLFLGTNQDNVDDKMEKGRAPRGEKNGLHKLTEEEVLKIRAMYKEGHYSQRELGKLFGVVHSRISSVVRKVAWTHI